jgi:hypothetical protein
VTWLDAHITVEDISDGTGACDRNLAMLFMTMTGYCANHFEDFRAFAITTADDEDQFGSMPEVSDWFRKLTPEHLGLILDKTKV